MEQRVSISISDGIADVRLVRADKMNALDAAMFDALVAATERLSPEKGVRAVVLSGEGRAFCAGLDMGRLAAVKETGGNGIAGGEKRDLSARTHGLADFRPDALGGWPIFRSRLCGAGGSCLCPGPDLFTGLPLTVSASRFSVLPCG